MLRYITGIPNLKKFWYGKQEEKEMRTQNEILKPNIDHYSNMLKSFFFSLYLDIL